MTIDQILVMVLPIKQLQATHGVVEISTAEAAALGLVRRDSNGESLVQRIRASEEHRRKVAAARAERKEERRRRREKRRAEIERQTKADRAQRRKERRRRRR
jgi:hypothetical protein